MRALLLPWATVTGQGWAIFPQFPWFSSRCWHRALSDHVALPLAPVTLGRGGLSGQLHSLFTAGLWFPCSPFWLPVPSSPSSDGRLWGWVVWPGPSLPLCKSKWLLLPPPLCPHPWPHSWGLLSVLVWLLPCPVWVSVAINFAICCFSFAIPSTDSVITIALSFTQSWVSSLLLSAFQAATMSWNTICQRCYRGTRQSCGYVSSPMEEAIPEVLLSLQICHPPGALELNLVKGPFQPCGKGRNLFTTPLPQFIKTLHDDTEWGHHAKDDQQFA